MPMPSNLEIINPITYTGYDELVLDLGGSFFHTSHWARVLHETYNYRPVYVSSINDRKLKALIPLMEVNSFLTGKRGVALPFTDYCEPFLSHDFDKEYIFSFVKDHAIKNGWKYVEVRGSRGLFNDANSFSRYYGHTLNLSPDEHEIYMKFRSTTQRNIRKAVRAGVATGISTSFDAIKEFCRLNCITRKRHGIPPQPIRFFEKIYEHVICGGHGIIVSAFHEGKIIAASIYFHFGENAIYKYGASDTRYQHLRPNNLIMWEAIRWYCRNGYQSLHFGRTEPENAGLLRFKSGWGSEESFIDYFRYDLMNNTFVKTGQKQTNFHNTIFRKMPDAMLKLSGSLLYRHMG